MDDGMPLPAAMRLARERGIIASRQLSKRQLTWLRSMPTRRVVACDSATLMEDVQAVLAQWQT
jgi:tRNA dimethylallyltransferase